MFVHENLLDPALTCMDSAQAFGWSGEGGRYAVITAGREMYLEKQGNGWRIEGDLSEDEMIRFFDLDLDYTAIFRKAADLKHVREAFALLPGLRLMNQPAWEALLMFICSSNNNTKRIRSLVLKLCERYGSVRKICGVSAYGLPDEREMLAASAEELREMKFGYRADYLVKTAEMVNSGFDLCSLEGLPYEQARERIMRLPGVGPKVADCVLLFGFGYKEAFPVDVWVHRLLASWYGIEEKTTERAAAEARALFGPYAGIIQQYLFHCARCGLIATGRKPDQP